jgi:hypothetical protein
MYENILSAQRWPSLNQKIMIYNNPICNIGQAIQISSASIDLTGFMLGQRVNYTTVTGVGIVSTANSNLNGTGILTQILTTAAIGGVLIRRVVIKAQGNTTKGMVRLFISNGTTSFLISETEISIVTQSSIASTFSTTLALGFYMQSGYVLYASTQNAETFIVTAEGLSITYP